MLETKWQLLQSKSKPDSKLEHMLKSYISSLRAQLDRVNKDKEHLDLDLKTVHVHVEEQKQRSFIRHFNFSLKSSSKFAYFTTTKQYLYSIIQTEEPDQPDLTIKN